MKALSIRAPWWWLILHAGKRIENRAWKGIGTRHRGPLLIHASASPNLATIRAVHSTAVHPVPDLSVYREHRGGIVGICDLADVRPNVGADPWEIPGQLGLVLANVRPLPFVPCRGSLGLFDVPDAIMRGVL